MWRGAFHLRCGYGHRHRGGGAGEDLRAFLSCGQEPFQGPRRHGIWASPSLNTRRRIHGARIEFHSELGRGTSTSVHFPVQELPELECNRPCGSPLAGRLCKFSTACRCQNALASNRLLPAFILCLARTSREKGLDEVLYRHGRSRRNRRGKSWGCLAGVTTNPSLYAKTGGKLEDFEPHMLKIAELCEGLPVSAESTAPTAEGMVEEGRRLSALAPNIVVKLPICRIGPCRMPDPCERGRARQHDAHLLGDAGAFDRERRRPLRVAVRRSLRRHRARWRSQLGDIVTVHQELRLVR